MLVLNIEVEDGKVVSASLQDGETGHIAWHENDPNVMVIEDKQKSRLEDWRV